MTLTVNCYIFPIYTRKRGVGVAGLSGESMHNFQSANHPSFRLISAVRKDLQSRVKNRHSQDFEPIRDFDALKATQSN